MTAELAALPWLRCPCGWRYRERCTSPAHWPGEQAAVPSVAEPPRFSPRRLTLEVVRPPDGEGVAT